MKQRIFYLVTILSIFGFNGTVCGSWLIDPAGYHISAHGQISCRECHGGVEQGPHPDPLDVNRKPAEFFSTDICEGCHQETMAEIGQGAHGSQKSEKPERFSNCIDCHNPHYQLSAASAGRFAPEKPHRQQCGACHEIASALPPLAEDESCLACHREVDTGKEQGRQAIAKLCFTCHGQPVTSAGKSTGISMPFVDEIVYLSSAHAKMSCTTCHFEATRFGHGTQKRKECSGCHAPHPEKTAHDAHAEVTCEACHLQGVEAIRSADHRVLWKKSIKPNEESFSHLMVTKDHENLCRRCHFEGNEVGAASMILPAKGFLCMPCHTATFSVWDTITASSLLVFLAGIACVLSHWLTGSIPGKADAGAAVKLFALIRDALKGLCSARFPAIIKGLFLEVLLQRRLHGLSRARWLNHSLIFYPFVFRFTWGIVALMASLLLPESAIIQDMIDKNHPLTGFLFDLSGVSIIVGASRAIFLRTQVRSDPIAGFAGRDCLASALIAGIVAVGFILEGMRIAMTGYPRGAGYSFLGYGIGILLSGAPSLTSLYGYGWYVHAALTGTFIACIPFSRMFHMVMAPIVLAMHSGHRR